MRTSLRCPVAGRSPTNQRRLNWTDHIAMSISHRKLQAGVFNVQYPIASLHENGVFHPLSVQCPHQVFHIQCARLGTCTYANKIKLQVPKSPVLAPTPDVRTSNTNRIYLRGEGTYNTCSAHRCSGKGGAYSCFHKRNIKPRLPDSPCATLQELTFRFVVVTKNKAL